MNSKGLDKLLFFSRWLLCIWEGIWYDLEELTPIKGTRPPALLSHSLMEDIYWPCWTLFRLCWVYSPRQKQPRFLWGTKLFSTSLRKSCTKLLKATELFTGKPNKQLVYIFLNYNNDIAITFQVWTTCSVCPCNSISMLL